MTITFKVNSYINEEKIELNEFSFNSFLEEYFKKQVKSYDEFSQEEFNKRKNVINSSFKLRDSKELKAIGRNSFVYSCFYAYSGHYHLSIRPDDVYLAIMVQFSFYVNKHSERFRERLVEFKDKEVLEVLTNDPILVADHSKLTRKLCDMMKSKIKDPSIVDWLIPSFSTTTDIDKVSYSAVLLSTMKHFFEYRMRTRCGLPTVSMEGTLEDWVNLKERLQKLVEFNLTDCKEPNDNNLMDKWLLLLNPILDQFILSVTGKPDLQWWNSIVDHQRRSGSDSISGWLVSFCCFDSDGNWIALDNSRVSSWPKIETAQISNGFVNVPILLIDADGTIYKSTLFSGHIATSTINDSKIIKPLIDWFLLLDQ